MTTFGITRALRIAPALAGVVAALSAGALGGGCGDFQDETTVIDLRVLGLEAEPPELFMMVDNGTVTGTDSFSSDVTALVIDPKGAGRPVSYEVLACPRAIDAVTAATGRNGVDCTANVPGMTPTSLEIPTSSPTADPGPVHEIKVHLELTPLELTAALSVDPFAQLGGFQLPIVVQFALAAGTETVITTKRVIFSQPITDRPPQPPNQNPTITALTTYPARDKDAMPINPVVSPAVDAPVTVALGGSLWFEPGGAIAEPYSTRVLTRDTPPQVVTQDIPAETLRFAFFATAGSFSPGETSSQAVPIFNPTDRVHLESQYSAPRTMPADPKVTFWIVVRDERGGASWIQSTITLVP